MFSVIVCTDRNGAIGYNNKLLFHLNEDLKRFKKITTGKTVVMGYNTFKSLPFDNGFSDRKNIILSQSHKNEFKDIECFESIESFLDEYKDSEEEIFVVGGSKIYELLLPYCNKIYLTYVDKASNKVDSWFFYNEDEWSETGEYEYLNQDGLDYYFIELGRI